MAGEANMEVGAREHGQVRALGLALGAHAIWGSMPLYLILVRTVPTLEYVAWRTLFTLPVCLLFVSLRRTWPELARVLRDRRAVLTLCASALLIGVNWLLYVWAIQQGYIYAASLGYYVLPLAMMLLGMIFLGERLSKRQWAAVGLAAIGVAALAAGALTTLWLTLACATTFAFYGLLRKTVRAGPLVGLAVESMILLPVVCVVLLWFGYSDTGITLGRDGLESLAIVMGGPITAIPLILFATATRALPYTVIGFLQFTSPTIVFLLGVFFFGEELKPAQLTCFIAIWAAAAFFIWELLRGRAPQAGPAG